MERLLQEQQDEALQPPSPTSRPHSKPPSRSQSKRGSTVNIAQATQGASPKRQGQGQALSEDLASLLTSGLQNLFTARLAKIKGMYHDRAMTAAPQTGAGENGLTNDEKDKQSGSGAGIKILPKQFQLMNQNILSKTRRIEEIDQVKAMREKELYQLDREVRIYELKNAVTNKILSKIQADEIKRTIDKGSILGGRWDGVVYAGVDNQYVQQRLIEATEQQQAKDSSRAQSYQ